jgi:tetratricopeptide (TPR) repeat protein
VAFPTVCTRTLAIAAFLLIAPAPLSSSDAQDPKNTFVDSLELIALLRAENFEALERRLTSMQLGYESGRILESKVGHAFGSFANSAPDLESKLNAWITEKPRSYAAHAARGMYFWHLGWISRQFAFARSTSAAEWEGMRRNFTLAERDLRAALEVNPRLAFAHATRFNIFSTAGNRNAALDAYRHGLRRIPNSYLIRYQYLADLRPEWHGSIEAMQQFLRTTRAQRIPNPEIHKLESLLHRARARRLRDSGQHEDAIRILTEGLKSVRHWSTYEDRGRNYLSKGEYAKAIEDFDRGLELNPQDSDLITARAESHRRAGMLSEAMKDLNLALKLDSLSPLPLSKRAFLLRANGKYEEALRDLNAALTYGAHKAYYWAERGDIYYYYLRDFEKAATDFKRAIEIDEDFPFYWYKYSHSLFFLKDCDTGDALARYLVLCRLRGDCQAKNHRIAIIAYRIHTRSWRCPFDRSIIVIPLWQKLKAWVVVLGKPVVEFLRELAFATITQMQDDFRRIKALFESESEEPA